MTCPELVEVKDGLLASEENEIMKARSVSLFPDNVKSYYENIETVKEIIIQPGSRMIKMTTSDKQAFFDLELFEYVYNLHPKNYYLSGVPISKDEELYTLFVEYEYGICVIAPMGV